MKKKLEMRPETYASKFAADFAYTGDPNISSYAEISSTSTDDATHQKMATFPFKPTPSGNLKVQSNQVVFQSSTVGVLLADPTQAKVKVKFEGKSAEELDDELNNILTENHFVNNEPNPQLQYGRRTNTNTQLHMKNVLERNINAESRKPQETKNRELISLGYGQMEPIDWMHVQLPKKLELFQEFYRRVHNFINTDCIVHIGREEFHCHYMVLQIYSSLFNTNTQREIELPISNVKPDAFHTIYEWMIFSGSESNKLLKRENILDLYSAAQYLVIKDRIRRPMLVVYGE